jgi:L-lactate dehydrogenase complex protein LldG
MNEVRAEIFRNIQRATGRPGYTDAAVTSIMEKRLSLHARGPVPVYQEPPLTRFMAKLKHVSASVTCIDTLSALPQAVEQYLSQWQISKNIVAASSTLLKNAQWPQGMTTEHRHAQADDVTALTFANAGVAETGTLVLCSSPETPTTLNFLPDNYICVINQADIYPCMEDIWDLLRNQGKGMPRSINFITGPSRTADVEQTIQLGAHGPRRLHVIILTAN